MDTMKMSFENLHLQVPLYRDEEMKVKELLSISAIVPIEVTMNGESFVLMSQESFDELMESEEELEELLMDKHMKFREDFFHKQTKAKENGCDSCSDEEDDYFPEEDSCDEDSCEEEEFFYFDMEEDCLSDVLSQLDRESHGDTLVAVVMDLLDEHKLSKEQLVHLGEIVEAHELLASAREVYGVEEK